MAFHNVDELHVRPKPESDEEHLEEDVFDVQIPNDQKAELLHMRSGIDPNVKFLGYMHIVAFLRGKKFEVRLVEGGGFFDNEMDLHNEELRKELIKIIEYISRIKLK